MDQDPKTRKESKKSAKDKARLYSSKHVRQVEALRTSKEHTTQNHTPPRKQ